MQPELDFFTQLPCAILVTDAHGAVVRLNPRLRQLIQMHCSDASVESMDDFLTPASQIFCQTHVWPLLRREGVIHEIFLHLRDAMGQSIPVFTNAENYEKCPDIFLWIFLPWYDRAHYEAELLESRRQSDFMASQLAAAHENLRMLNAQLQARIEQSEDLNRRLTVLTHTDTLTGLGNRRVLIEAATVLGQDQSTTFSVLMIDIDHFKSINDTFGHDKGDVVLQIIGQCLHTTARQGDAVVRYGGEEFALILPNTSSLQARQVAQRVHEVIAFTQPGGLVVTVSIGAATAESGQSHDLLAMLKLADQAVYFAKNHGRNQTVHHDDISAKLIEVIADAAIKKTLKINY